MGHLIRFLVSLLKVLVVCVDGISVLLCVQPLHLLRWHAENRLSYNALLLVEFSFGAGLRLLPNLLEDFQLASVGNHIGD